MYAEEAAILEKVMNLLKKIPDMFELLFMML